MFSSFGRAIAHSCFKRQGRHAVSKTLVEELLSLEQETILDIFKTKRYVTSTAPRWSTSLPDDIAEAARKARFPKRLQAVAAAKQDVPDRGMPGTSADTSDKPQEDIVSSMMFPWEKRQLQGGKLSTWEKYYWGVFVVAISVFLFNRAGSWVAKDPKEIEEEERLKREIEEQKKEKARLILAGASMLEDEEDPFDGLSPEEIEKYVESATGANSKDPFDGMSPEEINEYIEKNKLVLQ